MLLYLLNFIKNKLFSTTGVFFLIFGVIISTFLFFNSNVILSKFGFETTTTLKSEVTRLQSELKQLKSINDNLNKDIKNIEDMYKKQLESIVTLQEEKRTIEKKVKKIVKTYTDNNTKLNKDIELKVEKTTTELTIPIAEIDQLSFNNISALNNVHSELFEF